MRNIPSEKAEDQKTSWAKYDREHRRSHDINDTQSGRVSIYQT